MENRTFRAACLLPGFEYRDIFIKQENKFVLLEAESEEEMREKLRENQKNLKFFLDEDDPKHLFGSTISYPCDIIIYTYYKMENPYAKGIAV